MKITAHLIYPEDFKLGNKDIELNELEFKILSECNKIGSEGKYFEVEEMILEDTDTGISVSIILK